MGSPIATERHTIEAENAVLPPGWLLGPPSPANQPITLLFGLKQTNLAHLEKRLLAVSDPQSAEYGQHLTNEQVHELIAPTATNLAAVMDWLGEHDIVPRALTPNSDWLTATMPISLASRLLNAEYREFTHAATNTTAHRVLRYSVPRTVSAGLDLVAPTLHLPLIKSQKRSAPVQEPHLGNGPKHLRELYSVDVEGAAESNRMAVTAFIGQHYSKADLHEFWTLFCGGIHCGKGDPVLKGDATSGLLAGVEAMLDIETITGIAGNISAEFWGYKGHAQGSQNEPFLTWLAMLSNTSDNAVPKVFSTSYGEDEASWSLSAATRMNVEFQKAGLRGISLLYASGDEGANCKSDKFVPETPGSSPWVTAVGGTEGASVERAIGLSSGGFSSRWAMPDYQTAAVHQYMAGAGIPAASYGYNTSGRAYPDISAQASGFTVVSNRIPEPGVAGTSCASPTAAGVIALLNDARIQAGKSTLGFLNPLIYKHSEQWNDISSGASTGCDLGDGWPAAKGWDAVTGVGTPNYKKLVAAVLALP
jgi:tripeptidyl-peptidase-1